MVILCANQERDSGLIEAPSLPVPFFDGVQGALPCQVKHEQYGDSIVAHQRQHVDEFSLTTQIPDREGNFRVPDRDGLLHEVHTCKRQSQTDGFLV